VAAKLSWKVGLHPLVALVAGAGGSDTRNSSGDLNESQYFGGDLGIVVAPSRLRAMVLRPYLGLRTGVGVVVSPMTPNTPGSWQLSLTPVVSGGLSIEPNRWLRIMLEAGYLGQIVYDPILREVGTETGAAYGGMSLVFIAGR
jgi:hypothetical protein